MSCAKEGDQPCEKWTEKIHPGKVFDLDLPLDQVAEGYRSMDKRRAIKAILQP